MRMNTTLVINSKGGSGKTTIATNLASYFAASGVPTTVMDYDPQGSSMNWLRLRNQTGTRLHGANAAPQKSGRIRGVEMFVPADTQQLVIDAPAGASGLLLQGRIRTRNIRLAVVANRVRSSMPVYQPLERFLNSLSLPFLTRVGDSDAYVKAAEAGIGIFELPPSEAAAERGEFMPIVEWVKRQPESGAPEDRRVVDLARMRRIERGPAVLSPIGFGRPLR